MISCTDGASVWASGDYDGLGSRRTEELKKSCKILGISSDQIIIENDSQLPDNPDINWNEDDVMNKLIPVIYKLQPNAVS
ncbi:hypothetical protein KUTeg_009332 [Tegillarca granosa]|uniref:N-acetylglucosaminylphosphatidylinositol deacetylase n=1 Tax=Tegillarca granosa TaxID=220873 RepID=A0ABQ9F3I3_TEGGR|nr:hypothetical protein KUTeg_009332 [Tegillarca granosa]